MSASENQIVVYQPNETIRLDVRLQKCCQCDNVAIYQFPISSRGGGMMEQLKRASKNVRAVGIRVIVSISARTARL